MASRIGEYTKIIQVPEQLVSQSLNTDQGNPSGTTCAAVHQFSKRSYLTLNPTPNPPPSSIPPLHRNPSQPKRRPLADVQNLGHTQQRHERRQIPFEILAAQQAPEEH